MQKPQRVFQGQEAWGADLGTIHKRFAGIPSPSVGFYRPGALDAPMRALLAVLAVAATVSLSGCMWWGDEMRGGAADGDAEFPLVLLGILVLVGIVLVVVNLSQQDSAPPPAGPPSSMAPHVPSGPAPPSGQDGWMEVEDLEEPASAPSPAKRRSTSKRPAKQARRRAP